MPHSGPLDTPGRRGATAIDLLVVAMLAIYVVLFLSVRGATNACLFVLVLFAIMHLARQGAAFAAAWRLDGSRVLVAALASLFTAAVIAKALRGEFPYAELDGPSRLLVSADVLHRQAHPLRPCVAVAG
jgi:O-antigen ligase